MSTFNVVDIVSFLNNFYSFNSLSSNWENKVLFMANRWFTSYGLVSGSSLSNTNS